MGDERGLKVDEPREAGGVEPRTPAGNVGADEHDREEDETAQSQDKRSAKKAIHHDRP
jgi:hypothetical protein